MDFTPGLTAAERARLSPVGAHHIEQSGRWRGGLEIDGDVCRIDGTGSRDHSWGRRDWDAGELLTLAAYGDRKSVV